MITVSPKRADNGSNSGFRPTFEKELDQFDPSFVSKHRSHGVAVRVPGKAPQPTAREPDDIPVGEVVWANPMREKNQESPLTMPRNMEVFRQTAQFTGEVRGDRLLWTVPQLVRSNHTCKHRVAAKLLAGVETLRKRDEVLSGWGSITHSPIHLRARRGKLIVAPGREVSKFVAATTPEGLPTMTDEMVSGETAKASARDRGVGRARPGRR